MSLPDADDPFADFIPVRPSRSGALVRRSPGGMAHAKTALSAAAAAELRDERDRLGWLAGAGLVGIEVPRVLDFVDGPRPTLVTSTLPGVAASSVPVALRGAGIEALREAIGRLHALDPATCGYESTLAVTVARASRAVAEGTVDGDDLDAERAGRSPQSLLEELLAGRERAESAQEHHLVVCHGDATTDNVLVEAGTGALVGIVDVGRLGVADRHRDLALAQRDGLDLSARAWTADADQWLLHYYRLLDEFA